MKQKIRNEKVEEVIRKSTIEHERDKWLRQHANEVYSPPTRGC